MKESTAPRWRPAAWDWGLTVATIVWTYAVHRGIGPTPVTTALAWYQPSGFLTRMESMSWAFSSTGLLLAVLALPAAALVAAGFVLGRSALARALGVSALIACMLFVFYGNSAVKVWEFFAWRTSAVLVCLSLTLGFSLCTPLLAASWLRLRWPLRIVVFLPVFLGVLAFLRNATGTDPNLAFNISPWPVVPVFGIEVGAFFALLWWLGAALGTGGIALGQQRPAQKLPLSLGGIALGLLLPVLVVKFGDSLRLLPFSADARTYGPILFFCALAIAIGSTIGVRGRPDALQARVRHLAAGAALIAVPLVIGEVWARWDYYRTRERDAREIIDALNTFASKDGIYPDSLEELVDKKLLDEVPRPSIGFSFLYDGEFRYTSFGSSFNLEFPAPRWVECAFSPGYVDEEDPEMSEPETWSCPFEPPELW